MFEPKRKSVDVLENTMTCTVDAIAGTFERRDLYPFS